MSRFLFALLQVDLDRPFRSLFFSLLSTSALLYIFNNKNYQYILYEFPIAKLKPHRQQLTVPCVTLVVESQSSMAYAVLQICLMRLNLVY